MEAVIYSNGNQECYNELMEWRNEIISYLDHRRNEEFG